MFPRNFTRNQTYSSVSRNKGYASTINQITQIFILLFSLIFLENLNIENQNANCFSKIIFTLKRRFGGKYFKSFWYNHI